MTYIQHLTLSSGHSRRIEPGEVSGQTLALVGPWLETLIASGGKLSLPRSDLSRRYCASATIERGALLMTVFVRDRTGMAPLVTFGVAKRRRHGDVLWPYFIDPQTAQTMFATSVKRGVQRPAEPWCAVLIHLTLALADPSASAWLGDFERCVAWAWVHRAAGDDEPDDTGELRAR